MTKYNKLIEGLVSYRDICDCGRCGICSSGNNKMQNPILIGDVIGEMSRKLVLFGTEYAEGYSNHISRLGDLWVHCGSDRSLQEIAEDWVAKDSGYCTSCEKPENDCCSATLKPEAKALLDFLIELKLT